MSGDNGVDRTLDWNGRAVKLVEFSIKEGRDVRAAYQIDGETGMWAVLVKAARYADDDAPVFASIDEIEGQPFRLTQRLMRLAAKAIEINGFDQPVPVDTTLDESGQPVPLH